MIAVSDPIPTILLVDDEASVLYTLEAVLRKEGYRTVTAGSAKEALDKLDEAGYDLIISDVTMPGRSGLDLLDAVRRRDPESLVILITAYGSEALAVEAMKRGAYDYLPKPFANDDLKITVRRALERRLLRRENLQLRERLKERTGLKGIIGTCEGMQRVFELIEKVAPNDVTVLITGESGTGKEMVANAIHSLSSRRDGPFIRVNCAALPETLIESELFGYERGAFSGAVNRRIGKFEMADKGTIFLDEIGDMSLATQTKILRILQEREFERLGGHGSIRVDTRVLAATNRDLVKGIREGNFREDLYYRLNVVNIQLPPLRERRADIPLLTQYFAARFCEKFKKPGHSFSDGFIGRLLQHPWPGNVRELQNLIERSIILEDENLFSGNISRMSQRPVAEIAGHVDDTLLGMSYKEAKEIILRGFESSYFQALLDRANGNISKAARQAGMHRKNLYTKLKELNLLKRDHAEELGSEDGAEPTAEE